jgi:glycerophosphoryl diester phosphodiesterase
MTFNINWDKRGVYVKFRGVVTAQDLIDANNYVISNANFDKIHYQIFDFSNIDDFKITSYDINIIGVMDKSQTTVKKKMKVAVVSDDDYVKEITGEYAQIMSNSDWDTKVFPTNELAKKWVSSK